MNWVRFFPTAFLLASLTASPLAMAQEPKSEKSQPAESDPAQVKGDDQQLISTLNNLITETIVGKDPADQIPRTPQPNPANPPYLIRTYGGHQSRPDALTIDPLFAHFGLSVVEADSTLRAQLEIPKGEGIVVAGTQPGGLADQAGLKISDVLLSLGNQKANDVNQVRATLLGLGKEAISVKLIREGKPRTLSLVGPEHGIPAEVSNYWIGVPISPVDATLRAHLLMLPADSGLIANDVVKGSPAEQASVVKDDILISMDGKPLKDSESLIAQVQATQGKPVPLKILRAGKELTITITPAKRAVPATVQWTANFNLGETIKYRVLQPMAIEIEPKSTNTSAAPASPKDGKIEVKPLISGKTLRVDPKSAAYPFPTAAFWSENRGNENVAYSRIEAQMKAVEAKLDGITKALEGLKKAVEK